MPEPSPLDVLTGSAEPAHQPPGAGRRSVRRERRRRRRGRRAGVLLLALAVVAAGTLAAVAVLRPVVRQLTASDDWTGNGTGRVAVRIGEGASGASIGDVLVTKGVVKTAAAFVAAVREDTRAATVEPGTYRLRSHMSARAALQMLLDPSSRTLVRVQVREGLRAAEVLPLLARASGRPLAQYRRAARDASALGLPAAAHGRVEGYLFPATYEFDPTSTPAEQLHAMVARCLAELRRLGVPAGRTQRTVVVASIAEVEARSTADYARVARVLDNRLAKGVRLQLDSTVSYAVGKRALTTSDAQRAVRSPWNTYVVPGLPAGPISNPGSAALAGALHPAPGPWTYFVTVDPARGTTRFAVTKAQHDDNVAVFRAWCRAHPGRC